MQAAAQQSAAQGRYSRTRGYTHYELTNHLGNVLAVITDRKLISTGAFYTADVLSLTDYYAFGQAITERTYNASAYRYSMNGQEKDTDIDAHHTTALYWEYDSRIGRRWNTDPIVKIGLSLYSCFGNNPIMLQDKDGDDWYVKEKGQDKGKYEWHKGSAKIDGLKNMGAFKVEYDPATNNISIYKQDAIKPQEVISMAKNADGKYTSDRSAKFAMISAETGGVNVNDADPRFDPLVISASIDNRQKVADSDEKYKARFTSSTNQEYKGFHAKSKKAYKEFKYGNQQRFNGNMLQEHQSLTTVYNAMDSPVTKLEAMGVKDAKQILYYSHPGGSAQDPPAYSISYPNGLSTRFVSVQGDTKHKTVLEK